MIQRLTNLNGLSIVTNYLHPSQPDASNYNIKEFDMNNQGVLLLKVSGLTYSYVDELAKMKLIIPVTNMSNGVKFFAREVTTTYTTSVKWPGPSVNTSQIEGEHEIEYTYGSGISAPEIYYVILDLTNLARKWKKSGTTNRSIAIYTTASNIHVVTPRHADILNKIEVLSIENARQTGLSGHLSFTEQEVGFAGKGFVNNLTGKLLASFAGFATDSQKAPISIAAFYAQHRPTGISPLNQKLSMPSNWRMSFDFGVSHVGKRITVLHPDGSVQHFDETTKDDAKQYDISTSKDVVYINFFDFSYIEDQGDFVIHDRQKSQMRLSKTGFIKEITKEDGSKITFVNNGTRITSINADGRNVTISYNGANIERVEFIEEAKSLFFEYGTYGPTRIRLQDIVYISSSTSSGGSISTKDYVDRYDARYEYNGSVLVRMIDLKSNIALKFDQTSLKVTKITNQVYSPLTNGAFIDISYDATREHTKLQDYQGNVTYMYFNSYGQCNQKVDGDGNALAMQFGKISEDGTQQMLQDASPVIFNVRNQIINHSFDETVNPIGTTGVGWKTDAPATVKVVDGGVYGDKCLRVRKTSTGTTKIFQLLIPQKGNYSLAFFTKSKDAVGTAKVNVKIYYSETRPALPGEIGMVDDEGNAYVIVDSGSIIKDSVNVIGTQDWTRFVITGLNIPQNATLMSMELNIICEHSQGEVFFDDFQMVLPHRTSYNLIQNGYFDGETGSLPLGWTPSNNYHYQDRLVNSYLIEPFDKILGSRNMMLTGDSDKLKTLSTHLAVIGGAGEEFTLVAWAKGYVLATDILRVKVTIDYPEFDSDNFNFDFSSQTTNWQMLLRSITTSKPYSGITVSIEHQGPNTVNFDSIQLYKDASGKHYNYDEKGNLLDQMNGDKTTSSLSYDENSKVTQSVDPSGDTYKYTYDGDKLTEINDAKGNQIKFEYDDNGNRKKSEINSIEGKLVFEQTFNNQNKVISTKDELGNISTISYDSKGRIHQETNAKGVVKTSSYDAYDNLIQLIQSQSGSSTAHTYEYNSDQSLKTITTDNGTKYNFVYDNLGKLKQVKVNNQVFASYEHNHIKNGVETDLITKQTYGTDLNESFDFTYDTKGRLQQVKFRNEVVATYHYNDKGQVYQIDTNTVTKYFSYDLKGKLIKESDTSGKVIRFDYDNLDQVQKATFDINGAARSYDFEYTNEFNQYSRDGLRTRIGNAFGDDVAKDYFSYNGVYGMRPELVSSALFGTDNTISDRVITLIKNSSRITYDLSTVNSLRKTGQIHGGWYNEIQWKNQFIYNKAFTGWFRPVNLTDEKVIFSMGKDSMDYWKISAKKTGSNYIFTLRYTKDGANDSHGILTIPATNDWIFVGLRISKADGNTEIYFGVDDKFQYNFKSGLNVIHLVNKATIGDRSQPYGGSDEPNTVYQLKVHMLGIGAYRHTKNTFSMLYSQGNKYIINQNTVTAKTGVSFENPEIYDGLDTVTLNGTFISKSGIKPISYSYADKSYALDKTRLFEYDALEGKHVYGSYDGLMGMSDTKGKLIYDFDLKYKGTLSIRIKPLVSSTTDRTIIMNKKDGIDLFGAVLKSNNKLYMVLNGSSYPTNGITVPTSGWFTVVLKWNGTQYSVIANGVEIPAQTMTTSLAGAQTIVGSNLNGQQPDRHLNGQLELLAYKDDVLNTEETSRLFQTNHMISVKTHVDILGRSKKDVIDTGKVKLENTYTYKSPGSGNTSLQVSSITKYDESEVSYEYDALGNVTAIITPNDIPDDPRSNLRYEYQYDYLNRLVREYNPVDEEQNGRTLIIAYTGNNNILSKKYYSGNQPLNVSGTPQESFEYSYDTTWKDKLISVVKKVNGTVADTESFAYNSNFMSNPSQIGSKTLTWEGKRLTHINSNIEYVYNEEGIRIRKTVDGLITKYELNGSNIVGEIVDDVLIARYHYNEKGLIVGFEYNQKQYYYIKDLLGIITEIVDENGNVMVSYKYDAWGKIIDKVVNNQTIDEVNHFVYKGYYLDNETQWYYLNYQYYNAINTKYISINSIADIVATKLRRSRKTSSISPSIFINKENDLSIDIRKNPLESEESSQEFDSPNDKSKSNGFGSSIFTNAYVAFSQTASVIASVVQFVGATSQGPLNSLTTYTIRYNNIAGNINVTSVGTLGDKVASAFKKVSIGLLIVSSVLQVVDNFTNDDYSLAEKVFNSAFDVGITVGLYFATASLGGPAGLAVAAIAFVALEVFDIDTHVKNWFKKIFNW